MATKTSGEQINFYCSFHDQLSPVKLYYTASSILELTSLLCLSTTRLLDENTRIITSKSATANKLCTFGKMLLDIT